MSRYSQNFNPVPPSQVQDCGYARTYLGYGQRQKRRGSILEALIGGAAIWGVLLIIAALNALFS